MYGRAYRLACTEAAVYFVLQLAVPAAPWHSPMAGRQESSVLSQPALDNDGGDAAVSAAKP